LIATRPRRYPAKLKSKSAKSASHRLQQIEALIWWHITGSWRQALSMNEEMKEEKKDEQVEKKKYGENAYTLSL
jgi:hypothetical protein